MSRVQPPVGIDLGTTYSVVAYLDSSGRPVTLPNSAGELLTPSALLFEPDGVVVGREALRGSVMEFDAYAECFKRDVGSDCYRRTIRNQKVPPEILSALILERLKQDAEAKLGPVSDAVITVPAFFDEARRKATQDAGRIAGLHVLDIINEPTAAAVAYAYQRSQLFGAAEAESLKERILVYDLGGGTFDVTILEIDGRRFRTVATDGDVQLGGKDFDERLVNFVAERFLEQHGLDPRSEAEDAAQLWLDVGEAKHALTERAKSTIVCFHAGLRSRVEITKPQFEQLTVDLLERTETTTSLVMKQAGLDWRQIDRVLLVGGASRMPMVAQMLTQVTGQKPDRSLSADEAVAHGAAIYCGMLLSEHAGSRDRHELINVNSHSLGVVGIDLKTRRKVNQIVIPRNTPLPCRVTRLFKTARADQRSVSIPIVEGESHRPEECVQLGDCLIRDLPPGLPKDTPVEVQYSYSSDGRIAVAGRVPATRQSAQIELKRNRELPLDSLDQWRQRLCVQTEQRTVEIASAEHAVEPASLQQRLDQSHMKLGQAVLGRDRLPPNLESKRRQAVDAAQKLNAAKQALKAAEGGAAVAVGSSESIRLSAELARLTQKVGESQTNLQFQLQMLGRECVQAQIEIPEQGRTFAAIKALQQALES